MLLFPSDYFVFVSGRMAASRLADWGCRGERGRLFTYDKNHCEQLCHPPGQCYCCICILDHTAHHLLYSRWLFSLHREADCVKDTICDKCICANYFVEFENKSKVINGHAIQWCDEKTHFNSNLPLPAIIHFWFVWPQSVRIHFLQLELLFRLEENWRTITEEQTETLWRRANTEIPAEICEIGKVVYFRCQFYNTNYKTEIPAGWINGLSRHSFDT